MGQQLTLSSETFKRTDTEPYVEQDAEHQCRLHDNLRKGSHELSFLC